MTKPDRDPRFKPLVQHFLQTNSRMTRKQAIERARIIILRKPDARPNLNAAPAATQQP